MKRTTVVGVVMMMLAMAATAAFAAELKPIKRQKANQLTVSVLSDTGQWKPGKNSFILAFTKGDTPVDVGKVTLNTSMPMPGMAPMIAGATLEPDGPGRYKGAVTFPDAGDRQVTVSWDGPAGKGSTRFTVPVR